MAYIVKNSTDRTIWWKDGGWNSGELGPGQERKVDTNHDANVTLYRGNAHDNEPLGAAWFPQFGSVEVYGKWNWCIRPQA